VLDLIIKTKKKITENNYNIKTEYIQIVNLARLIFVYIIQLLYDKNIRLNANAIQKFLVLDSELDFSESKDITLKLIKYDYINSKINTSKKIGKIIF
jgi:hypothetical protein